MSTHQIPKHVLPFDYFICINSCSTYSVWAHCSWITMWYNPKQKTHQTTEFPLASILSCLIWWPIKVSANLSPFAILKSRHMLWEKTECLSPLHKAQEWREIHLCRMQLPACWFGENTAALYFIKAIEELRQCSILASEQHTLPHSIDNCITGEKTLQSGEHRSYKSINTWPPPSRLPQAVNLKMRAKKTPGFESQCNFYCLEIFTSFVFTDELQPCVNC